MTMVEPVANTTIAARMLREMFPSRTRPFCPGTMVMADMPVKCMPQIPRISRNAALARCLKSEPREATNRAAVANTTPAIMEAAT